MIIISVFPVGNENSCNAFLLVGAEYFVYVCSTNLKIEIRWMQM